MLGLCKPGAVHSAPLPLEKSKEIMILTTCKKIYLHIIPIMQDWMHDFKA